MRLSVGVQTWERSRFPAAVTRAAVLIGQEIIQLSNNHIVINRVLNGALWCCYALHPTLSAHQSRCLCCFFFFFYKELNFFWLFQLYYYYCCTFFFQVDSCSRRFVSGICGSYWGIANGEFRSCELLKWKLFIIFFSNFC